MNFAGLTFRAVILRTVSAAMLFFCALQAGSRGPNGSGSKLPQSSGGLKGYISMNVTRPPDRFRSGVSFYASVWPLVETPLSSFQIGLPSTWIIPDNTDFGSCLCPPGTIAKDNWPERGPTYRDVFQTIEGGLGYWGSTQFGAAAPKYRMNGTPDCYNHEISSPGWGFGQPTALAGDKMGIAQLSNRLLIPPDGLTFKRGASGRLLGNAWMALPFTDVDADAKSPGRPPDAGALTGDQSWTLFLNVSNFKGPVAYWIPETWSRLSKGYATAARRGLDSRPALMNGGAMEVNTVPYFESKDAKGVTYTRVPKLHFPVDAQGRTVLMQDVTMYSAAALYEPMRSWLRGHAAPSGRFDSKASWTPACTSDPISFRQGSEDAALTGIDAVVKTATFGGPGAYAFGLEWSGAGDRGVFPEYYRQVGTKRVAVAAADVPAETELTSQVFEPAGAGQDYTSPVSAHDCWSRPGPRLGPFHVTLTDGSRITYSWYRFVDQPALQQLKLSAAERTRLQALVERIHARWPITGAYMPPPSSGTLAALDPALIVTPPHGLEVGYVPIVTRQAAR